MVLRIIYFGFFSLLFPFILSAKVDSNILNYTTNQGLSSNNVQSIYQDSKGFLWIGTDDGLNRYDGYNFKIYRYNIKNPDGIVGNNITTINEDSHKNIWVGVDGKGISYKRNGSEKFVPIYCDHDYYNKFPINKIKGILKDNQNNLWLTFNNFLIEHFTQENSAKWHEINHLEENLEINCLLQVSQNEIMVGTSDGIYLFDKENNSTLKLDIYINNKQIKDYVIYDLIDLKNESFLIGTDKGLFLYEKSEGFAQIVNKNFSNVKFAFKDADEIWIGYDNKILIYNIALNKIFTNRVNLPEDVSITSLVYDESRILWAGTKYDGVFKISMNQNKFHNNSFSNLSPNIQSNNIVSIQAENDSVVWLVTDFNEVIKFDIFSNKLLFSEKFNKNIKLKKLFKSSVNDLWVGTNQGVYKLAKNTKKFVRINAVWSKFIEDNLEDESILYFTKDSNNINWLASNKIIFSVEKDTSCVKYDIRNLMEEEVETIKSLLVDSDGNLIVATSSSLLYFDYEKKEFAEIKTENFLKRQILSAVNGFDDRIWLGTQIGLFKVDRIRQDSITVEAVEGVGDKKVNSVLVDEKERIWCAFNNSIAMLLLDGGIRIFDKNDGLSSKMLNLNSVGYLSSGNVLFGGIDGLYWLHPDSIIYNSHKPPIEIIEASVCYRGTKCSDLISQDSEEPYKIKYRPGMVLNFEFAALDFMQSTKNNFQYYLEGYDNSWHAPTVANSISYTNLPTGRYLLKVRASNNDFVWSDEMLEIQIAILSPLWLSKFAYVFYAFILIFIIQMFVNYRIRHYRKANRIF